MTPPKDDPTETDSRNGPIEAGGMRIVRPTDPQSWISEAKEKEAEGKIHLLLFFYIDKGVLTILLLGSEY